MPGVQPGRKNKLYYNSATYASPTWVEIARVGDVNRTGTKASTEVNMRASDTTIVVYGNKSREITFTYYKIKGSGTADPVFTKLSDSYENDTVLDIAMMEGPIATVGQFGVRGPFVVSQLDKAEPIDGVDTYDVTLQFADAEISAGNPFLFNPAFVTP